MAQNIQPIKNSFGFQPCIVSQQPKKYNNRRNIFCFNTLAKLNTAVSVKKRPDSPLLYTISFGSENRLTDVGNLSWYSFNRISSMECSYTPSLVKQVRFLNALPQILLAKTKFRIAPSISSMNFNLQNIVVLSALPNQHILSLQPPILTFRTFLLLLLYKRLAFAKQSVNSARPTSSRV